MKEFDDSIYDLMDRYWERKLNSVELAAFEKRLKEDIPFAKKVRLHHAIDDTLANKKEAAFLNTLQKIRVKETQKTAPAIAKEIVMPIRRKYTQGLLALAAALLLLVAFWFVSQQKVASPNLVTQYFQHQDISLSAKGSTSQAELKQAEQFFNSKKYAQAIPFFDRYLQEKPDNFQVRLYNAQAKIHNNQLEEADKELNTIMDSDSIRQLKEQAIWYKALILYQQNKIAECLQRLEQLKYASNKDLQFRAMELADELKE